MKRNKAKNNDSILNWLLVIAILLVVGATVYLVFFLSDEEVSMSPGEEGKMIGEAREEIEKKSGESFGRFFEDEEDFGDDFERGVGEEAFGNDSNKSARKYRGETLPSDLLKEGKVTFTPLIIYEKLHSNWGVGIVIILIIGVLLYFIYRGKGS